MYSSNASRKELAFTPRVRVGSKGLAVKRLQEWLYLQGYGVSIDGTFGPATLAALKRFQLAQGIKSENDLTSSSWDALVQPMCNALDDAALMPGTASGKCLKIAKLHLAQHPREAGGDNRGPWVRLYTGGNEGADWRWCAGFVSVVMKQACELADITPPIKGSLSCDTLASQALADDRFITGKSLESGQTPIDALGSCAIFLIRKSSGDWTHTGFAFNFTNTTFETIEGNTNDEGSANGYEVCSRTRKLDGGKDFIKLD
jgi:peptidoglycan hydrolase-like protein with peptidoglycan-binding domain